MIPLKLISLKKYLDDFGQPRSSKPDEDKLLDPALKAYRSSLLAMGTSVVRACPPMGADVQHNLAALEGRLGRNLTAALFQETAKKVADELAQWGGRTADYLKARARDARDMLVALARTAESVSERDQRYASHFTQLTSRLQAIANLEDLTQVRSSLLQKAGELKSYVDHMEQESRQLVAHLQAEVSTYETKLKAAEDLALRDLLTGLPNRRNVEERLQWRITHQEPFCVAMLDLNHLKQVNDQHGHPAGDSLLQQFARELSSHLRASDLVGRWGGDEFIVVLDSDLASANAQIERTLQWAFGDYALQSGAGSAPVKVRVDAAVGVVEWHPNETTAEVIARADAAMYQAKKRARQQ